MLKKTHIISGLLIAPLTLYAATSYQVDDIRFEGLQRVTVGAALLSMPLHAGDAVTPEDVSEAVWWVSTLPAHVNINTLEMMPVTQSYAGLNVHRQ